MVLTGDMQQDTEAFVASSRLQTVASGLGKIIEGTQLTAYDEQELERMGASSCKN